MTLLYLFSTIIIVTIVIADFESRKKCDENVVLRLYRPGWTQRSFSHHSSRVTFISETDYSCPVHTETFSCFQVEVVVLVSLEHSKQYKNSGKRCRVYGTSEAWRFDAKTDVPVKITIREVRL